MVNMSSEGHLTIRTYQKIFLTALLLSAELQSQPRHLQRILFLILILLISTAQRSLQFAASLLSCQLLSAFNASVQSQPENNFVQTEKDLWAVRSVHCVVCCV